MIPRDRCEYYYEIKLAVNSGLLYYLYSTIRVSNFRQMRFLKGVSSKCVFADEVC